MSLDTAVPGMTAVQHVGGAGGGNPTGVWPRERLLIASTTPPRCAIDEAPGTSTRPPLWICAPSAIGVRACGRRGCGC